MFRSIFLKTLYDKRWFIVGWALGIGAMFTLTASFFSSMDMSGLDDLLKQMPKGMEAIVGEMAAYGTIGGYIGNALYGIRFEMLAIPMVLVLANSLSVGEERSRRMYQLLAQPVSRLRIIFEKWLAGVVVIGLVMVAAYAAVALGFAMTSVDVPHDILMRQTAMAGLFAVSLFSLALGLGFAFGSKTIPIAVIVLIIVGSYLIKGFSSQVEWVQQFEWLSIFKYYNSAELVNEAITPLSLAVLSGIIGVGGMMSLLFIKRDIKEEG